MIGAFVRGLSMRDVESLCEEAGLGKLSKSTRREDLRGAQERFEAFRRRDLYEIRLVALFLDATSRRSARTARRRACRSRLGVHRGRRAGAVGGAAWDARVLRGLAELGRDLISRGLGAPMLIVADGAPG